MPRCVHNTHAPIIVLDMQARLFSIAFCHRGARLIKVNCRHLAYLSACGKYLQRLMHGAFWLEPQLTSDAISSTGAYHAHLLTI